MSKVHITLFLFLLSRIAVFASKLTIQKVYTTIAQQICHMLLLGVLLYLFRLQEPEQVSLIIGSNGVMTISPQTTTPPQETPVLESPDVIQS
jgi:hypothetical protein